jgi:S1-C subfamily serine protease
MSTYNPYPSRYSNPHRVSLWPLVLLLVLAGVLVWRFWPKGHHSDLSGDAVPRPVVARGDLAADEQTTIDIYRRVVPSVVHITNITERRRPFSTDVLQMPKGSGTGFVWSDNGIIVTNAHVVDGADAMEVILPDKDQTTYEAKSWVSYPDKDLAVLYIDAPKDKLRPIELGQSEKLQVGQKTYAIGNPFGLDQSLTTGIVSALNREIRSDSGRPIQGLIQTSAAINPGNSGGPLLDSAGLLIGMNTAIISPTGASAGIGFAIPVDEINRIIPKLIQELNDSLKSNQGPKQVSPPILGVRLAPDEEARRRGVSEGVLIWYVSPRSPADRAGLQPMTDQPSRRRQLGDIIVAIDGEPVRTQKDVLSILENHHSGDTVALTILRDDQRQDVKVTLATRR